MENKTALQEYVDMLQKWKDATDSYLEKKTLEDCIREAEHRIDTTERQQLEDAYKSGYADSRSGLEQDKSYYTTTHKTT